MEGCAEDMNQITITKNGEGYEIRTDIKPIVLHDGEMVFSTDTHFLTLYKCEKVEDDAYRAKEGVYSARSDFLRVAASRAFQ